MSLVKLGALTVLTMTAFAANSVLNRAALTVSTLDPAVFTIVRLLAGAAVLAGLVALKRGGTRALREGSFGSALCLALYAACFSFAYLSLSAGTGALLLFASVQIGMIVWGLATGERPRALRWVGIVLAAAGFVWLVAPGVSAPDARGATLMVVAGLAWAAYSLRGRGAVEPIAATAGNFLRASLAAPALLVLVDWTSAIDPLGVLLAVASGAVASGLGYALWYTVLPNLAPSVAAVVQLLVPVIVLVASVPLLGEAITARAALAGSLVLGGVALAIYGGSRRRRATRRDRRRRRQPATPRARA
jgi:drug/metabolite transporter (DMT)-like permease